MIVVLASLLLLQACLNVGAAPLSDAQERRLVGEVRKLPTADGSTVWETLQFVERMRPREFKVAEISSAYDAQRNLIGFSLCYFIGAKRLEGDTYCQSIAGVAGGRPRLAADGSGKPGVDIPISLNRGRDTLLDAVDATYRMNCIEPSGRTTC